MLTYSHVKILSLLLVIDHASLHLLFKIASCYTHQCKFQIYRQCTWWQEVRMFKTFWFLLYFLYWANLEYNINIYFPKTSPKDFWWPIKYSVCIKNYGVSWTSGMKYKWYIICWFAMFYCTMWYKLNLQCPSKVVLMIMPYFNCYLY